MKMEEDATYGKMQESLMEEARELSILCGVDVALLCAGGPGTGDGDGGGAVSTAEVAVWESEEGVLASYRAILPRPEAHTLRECLELKLARERAKLAMVRQCRDLCVHLWDDTVSYISTAEEARALLESMDAAMVAATARREALRWAQPIASSTGADFADAPNGFLAMDVGGSLIKSATTQRSARPMGSSSGTPTMANLDQIHYLVGGSAFSIDALESPTLLVRCKTLRIAIQFMLPLRHGRFRANVPSNHRHPTAIIRRYRQPRPHRPSLVSARHRGLAPHGQAGRKTSRRSHGGGLAVSSLHRDREAAGYKLKQADDEWRRSREDEAAYPPAAVHSRLAISRGGPLLCLRAGRRGGWRSLAESNRRRARSPHFLTVVQSSSTKSRSPELLLLPPPRWPALVQRRR
ncbi:hypothetical protein [Oryza sativa Japonica Group]|uniref:MADS-box domain-containing protein n=2 Tax=Oryza sativa subsp. japonica TaxID=39947 RepID=Q5ZBA5_ORYSJ|nr:hypothetical protein [Oryza sativa Japonica Group]BAD53198.1 hypothetical protein [Oryza sativa Japonica Group]